MESKDNMRDTHTSTIFNTHLMPISIHAFNHYDVVNKIIGKNMPVRWPPENALYIFQKKEFTEGSKTTREKRKLCEVKSPLVDSFNRSGDFYIS